MSGRTRGLLIALVAAVVVAVVIWQWRRPGDPPATERPAPTTGPGPATGRPPPAAGAGVALPAGPIDPHVDLADLGKGGAVPVTRTYVLDNGAVVRDHRSGDPPPPMAPPPMRPDRRTMSTEITAKIYLQLAPMVTACAATVPAVDRGDDPFTYVTMTVQVSKGRLTTSDVLPTTHDLKGASEQRFATCLADQARTIAIAADGEPDHADYTVQYPIRIRP